MKRGQQLTLQTLITIALVSLVLIILAVYLGRQYWKSSNIIEREASPTEYRAACLAKYTTDNEAYEKCVEDCKKNPKLEKCKLQKTTSAT